MANSDGTSEKLKMLVPHEHRSAILNEVHARPFRPIETPARLLHFAFLTTGAESDADRDALSSFCMENGGEPIAPDARHDRVSLKGVNLRWEQHNEFTTYCWYYKQPNAETSGEQYIRPCDSDDANQR
jgi:uncharacterized membrane-anchored protein